MCEPSPKDCVVALMKFVEVIKREDTANGITVRKCTSSPRVRFAGTKMQWLCFKKGVGTRIRTTTYYHATKEK